MSIYIYLSTVKFNRFAGRRARHHPADRLAGGGIGRPMRKHECRNIAGSERDIVVHVAVAGAGCDRATRCGG